MQLLSTDLLSGKILYPLLGRNWMVTHSLYKD